MLSRRVLLGIVALLASFVPLGLSPRMSYAQSDERAAQYENARLMGFVQSWPRTDLGSKPALCRMGGTCLRTRDYIVELQVRPYGKVKAWIYGPHGEDIDLEKIAVVQTTLTATNRSRNNVELRWDPAKHLFVGFLPTRLIPAAGPIRVQFRVDNKVQSGSGLVAVTPHPQHGGLVMAVGSYVFEITPRVDGSVEVIRLDGGTDSGKLALQLAALNPTGQPLLVPLKFSKKHKMFLGQVPVNERLGTGPMELELRVGGKAFYGGVEMAKPLTTSDLGGWNMIVGPYSVEVAKTNTDRLIAVVRDAKEQVVSAKAIHLEIDLHDATEDQNEELHIFTLAMRWVPDKVRFEGTLPTNFGPILWMRPKIHELKHDVKTGHEVKWRGGIRW